MIGISRSHLADVESRRTRPGADLILGLANLKVWDNGPNLNRDWLLTGEGEMLTTRLQVEAGVRRHDIMRLIDQDALHVSTTLVDLGTWYCLGKLLERKERAGAIRALHEKMETAHFGPREGSASSQEIGFETAFRTLMGMIALLRDREE